MSIRAITILFWIGAVYDGLLGLVFLVAPAAMFERFEVTPPNHYGYVRFPALLLIVFAIMFVAIARAPERNRNLVPYGVLLKASYCGVVFAYWVGTGIPTMWKPFAFADLVFGVLFVLAYRALGPGSKPARGRA